MPARIDASLIGKNDRLGRVLQKSKALNVVLGYNSRMELL